MAVTPEQLPLILLGLLAVAAIGSTWWAMQTGSPVWAIPARWLRWILLALLAALVLRWLGWSGYSLPVLFTVAFIAWFLLEGAFHWLAISAVSRSQWPLFPVYREQTKKTDWPADPRFIRLRDWLRRNGWVREQTLVSELQENVSIHLFAFLHPAEKFRLNVILLPSGRNRLTACFSVSAFLSSGQVLITDNLFLPFGGFYPEKWLLERHPWQRRPSSLLARHRARLDALGEAAQPPSLSPLEQMTRDAREVEQLNRELGFLHSVHDEEEYGRLTGPGKARLWQEWWTLSYLGKPLCNVR